MKRSMVLLLCGSVMIFATSSVSMRYGTGIAGFTGAPGSFGTCTQCHGGGFSSASGITITAVPAFTNNEYMPDSTYMISINAMASGFSKFGFDCEILNASNLNAGTMSANFPGGVKLLNAGARTNAVHTVPHNTATPSFTFPWKAPSSGSATIYAIVNAVNGNGSTSGDFPLSPVSLALNPKQPEPQDTAITSVGRYLASAPSIFPNPAAGSALITVDQKSTGMIEVTLIGLDGKVFTHFRSEANRAAAIPLDLKNVPSGTYFVNIVCGPESYTSRLIVL